jgi:hypothetical protein
MGLNEAVSMWYHCELEAYCFGHRAVYYYQQFHVVLNPCAMKLLWYGSLAFLLSMSLSHLVRLSDWCVSIYNLSSQQPQHFIANIS